MKILLLVTALMWLIVLVKCYLSRSSCPDCGIFFACDKCSEVMDNHERSSK